MLGKPQLRKYISLRFEVFQNMLEIRFRRYSNNFNDFDDQIVLLIICNTYLPQYITLIKNKVFLTNQISCNQKINNTLEF